MEPPENIEPERRPGQEAGAHPADPKPVGGAALGGRLFRSSLLLIGLSVAVLCLAGMIALRQTVLRQVDATGSSLALAVAHDLAEPLRADEAEAVSEKLTSLFQSDDVVYSAVLLEQGRIYAKLGDAGKRAFESGLVDAVRTRRSGGLLLVRAPVRDPYQRVFAVLQLGYSLDRARRAIHLGQALILLMGVLVVGGAAAICRIQAKRATAPLANLVETARAYGSQMQDAPPEEGADELVVLDRVMRDMAGRLKDSHSWVELHSRELEQMVRDRTEELRRKNQALALQNERVSEMSRLKSEFLANMSHELRTPLNAILALSELLRDEVTGPLANEEQRNQAAMIHSSGEGLLRLINDVLDLSRIEAGRLEIQYASTSTADLLWEAVEELRPLAAQKGLEVRTVLADGPEILLDADRVRQVVTNLLGNAIKFTRRGFIQLTSRFDSVEGRFAVTVEDTGAGIAPQDHEKVFHEFHQVDGSATRRHGGTGLGLAISRRLVRLMGGELSLRSDLGEGSAFTFWIPSCTEAPQCEPAAITVAVLEGAAPGLASIAQRLSLAGFEVKIVTPDQEAVEELRRVPPDCIVVDSDLAGREGLEILRSLEGGHAALHIPILVTTSRQLSPEDWAAYSELADRVVPPGGDWTLLVEELRQMADEGRNRGGTSSPDPSRRAA